MAVTLIGGKYSSATLSGSGATTVTIGTTPFVSGDFSNQRIVGLWDSTGATFKGIAYVRRYISTSQLELETEIFDPVDGSIATQVTGDILLVSKNWSDVATTGISVSNDRVDLTDNIVFGTSGDPDSLCFYDESKSITTNKTNAFEVAGGLVVHGHLQDYSTRNISGGCKFYQSVSITSGQYTLKTSSTAAHYFDYGGHYSGVSSIFVGGYLGSAPGSLVFTKTYSTNFISPSAGGNWGSNADRCVLNDCHVETTAPGVLVRWGDGVILGGSYKIPNYSSSPFSVFGTDVAGTRVISADAGERLIVLDSGNGNNYYRTGSAITITINSTNVIATDKTCGYGSGTTLTANTNATLNYYFKDRFTNIESNSVAVITLDSDGSTVDSVSSTGTTADLTVYHEQYVGSTLQFTRGPWTYGFKKYGYNVVSGAIAESTYSLGTAGTAENVSFGGPVIQIPDSNVTLSAAAAAALTTVDDCDEFYDAFNSWSTASVANAKYPSVGAYGVTPSGKILDFGARNITFSTGAGSVLSVATGTDTITVKPVSGVNAATKFDTIKTTGAIIGFSGTAKIDSATLDFPTAGTYSGTYISITADFSATGTFDLTGATLSGTIELTNSSGGAVTVQVATGTSYTNTGPSITVQEIGDTPTLTVSADIATATVRGFTNDTQTTVFSESDGSVDYEYPNTDPIDIEIVEQGYVPINEQDVVPFDGPINYTMDLDEAYNASHSLTIVTHYTLDRATKNFNILTDQNAFDVRSSMADTIRTNSSYYNTPLLLEAKPGGKRIDLIDGATITSMATWKGAGMERYDAADAINPVEKWYAIQSVQDITGASVIYRQTNSGYFTVGALTGGKFDETLQFYSDPDHDGTPTTENNSALLIKALQLTYREARNDVVAGNGGANLKADLYTIGLAPTAHDYSGTDPGISADLTMTAGPYTVGGKTFSYKWVDAGTNSGTDIADQIHYNRVTNPNGLIPGGTGLRWAEMPDMVIYVTGGVETAQGYREGATPTLVGFYLDRGGADHPDMVRAQADDGTYYTPAQSATATISNFATTSRLQIYDTLNAVELYNGVPGATSYQFSETYTVDRDIRVRITNKVTTTASIMIEATVGSITASNPDVAYIANQSADTTYNNNAVDGDMVTGITINDTTDRVEIGIAGGSVPWKNIYAYQVAWLHTEVGIRDDFAFIDAPDTANYILTGFKIKNTSSPSVPLVITGGYGRDATTGASIDLIDTTGGSLFFAPDHVIPYATGSGVTSADKTEIIAGVTTSVSDTLPDAVWQSPKAIPKLLSVE